MQSAAFDVHPGQVEPSSFRHAQAVAERQEQKATVADLVVAALGGFDQLFDSRARSGVCGRRFSKINVGPNVREEEMITDVYLPLK
jgi:hypothetical protein